MYWRPTRASRTVPFVSKATAVPLAKACARVMLGESIAELRAAQVLPATGDGGNAPINAPIAVRRRCCRSTGSGAPTAPVSIRC